MSRLIDADACPCNTCRTQCCENPRRCTFFGLWLLRQAYDVEKVALELRHLAFRLPKDYCGLDGKDRAVMFDDAIDIVKRGGAE